MLRPHRKVAIKWVRGRAEIRDSRGAVIFERSGIEVPESWSQLAVDILVSKYLRNVGTVGTVGKRAEFSLKQVIDRICRKIALPKTMDAKLRDYLVGQLGAFNSPVWFNLGLYEAYGAKAGAGGFRWDERKKSVVPVQNAFAWPQSSACFIQSVDDDLMAIFELLKTEAWLFKFGSGTGTNFSTLRGKAEGLDTGGTSSGLMSFLEILDRSAGAIKSGGTTRRAAKMVCLDVDHPEVMEFIGWKKNEEKKAAALIRAGYSSDFNAEAYHTVSGQNSNNSIRVTDAFMRAVRDGKSWSLRARTSGKAVATVAAKTIWDAMAEAAWTCADPGVQFHDTINAWHTCSKTGPIRASNPCSEYMFLDDSACNLASLNLVKFRLPDGGFDVDGFKEAVRVFITAQDRLVGLSGYPNAAIAENANRFRPLGLGYANLGTLLMLQGLPYDSDASRQWAAAITALMTGEAYRVSAELAKAHGPFAGFKKNRAPMLKVIRKHMSALKRLKPSAGHVGLLDAAQESWAQALKLGSKYGFRNAQVTVLAPTGTIGLLMDCDTTGIEPEYALVKTKKLAGGGTLTMVNRSLAEALEGLGYTPGLVKAITERVHAGETMQRIDELKAEHRDIFACAHEISPQGHLAMMAAVQPFLSGAISKTINMSAQATPKDIGDVYMQAWTLGLKSVAIYRDGSKLSQPLEAQRKCDQCGFAYVADGTCSKCVNCGSSLGCG